MIRHALVTSILLTFAGALPQRPVADTVSGSVPSPRAHHALAYDERRGRIVLYGGSRVVDGQGINLGDYQEWDGQRWSAPLSTGLERTSHQLVYDVSAKRLLLVGGMDGAGVNGTTYRWDDGRWTELTRQPRLALSEAAAAYDRKRQRVVLYGGVGADGAPASNTWELAGANWRLVESAGATPGPLSRAGMTYDERRQRIVLHGGVGADQTMSRRTWEWEGRSWTLASSDGPALSGSAFAYDPVRRQTVLFGGANGSFATVAETWTWNGRVWTQLPVTGPSKRGLAKMVFDRRRGVMVLFGGRVGYPNDSDETWEWNGSGWRRVGAVGQ